MTSLRPFARPVVSVLLLALALLFMAPASAWAKVEMVNGRDGAEGDPGDGVESNGGGSGYNPADKGNNATNAPVVIVAPVYYGYAVVIRLVPLLGEDAARLPVCFRYCGGEE